MSLVEQHYITKIEGHGTLNINFRQCHAKLEIDEGERFFEALLVGRPYTDGPFITSRICGVCPVAHTLASIKALESALDIMIDDNTIRLRKILLASQIIQSHALHLFFLTLPDYIGLSSTLELHQTKPELFKIALSLKNLGDKITTIIGGRNVHPINLVVGGFSKIPSKNELQEIKLACQNNLTFTQETVKLFASFNYPKISNPVEYMSLVNGESYETYDGKVETSKNYIFDPINYKKEIIEKVKSYSSAKFSTHDGQPMMVGGLARISLHHQYLNTKAKKTFNDLKIEMPSYNTFHNNLAQAIEMVHFLEEIIKLCEELINDQSYKSQVISYKLKSGHGIGAIEAPRGVLYHYYELDKKGIIKNCDIITPTAQNLTNIEEDATALLKEFKLDKLEGKVCIRELEMLIRAYDPCITCSVH
ncbi:MAG: nickel-dependent hydrogenase large subunit [uncultured bacterium]|nr:MAG: nickel-dependent hydrogenase large subunit [uncultured bacterium]